MIHLFLLRCFIKKKPNFIYDTYKCDVAQKPSYSRNSREVKFPSSTWMHHQQQQRLLLWRSLQSRSHVNSLQSVGTVRSLQVSPQSAVLKPPHHVQGPDYLRPAETRRDPQRVLTGEFQTGLFWKMRCWYRQLTVFCEVLLVSDWSSLRCSGFILDSSNRTWSPVRTEPSLVELTVLMLMKNELVCKSWFWCLSSWRVLVVLEEFPGSLKNQLLVIDRVSRSFIEEALVVIGRSPWRRQVWSLRIFQESLVLVSEEVPGVLGKVLVVLVVIEQCLEVFLWFKVFQEVLKMSWC